MPDPKELLRRNESWTERMVERDPDFFRRLAAEQHPEVLWIGCADSRVPANEILDLPPGEVFVHRNIANVVVHSDMSCLSVLQYAVEALKVRHVIVCGHYGCGGVRAALEGRSHGLLDGWLGHIKDVIRLHREALEAIEDEDARAALLCELNVREQVRNVCRTAIVQRAWQRGQPLAVHGWVYDVADGRLRDSCPQLRSAQDLEPHERLALE